jgi:hypothetical protein
VKWRCDSLYIRVPVSGVCRAASFYLCLNMLLVCLFLADFCSYSGFLSLCLPDKPSRSYMLPHIPIIFSSHPVSTDELSYPPLLFPLEYFALSLNARSTPLTNASITPWRPIPLHRWLTATANAAARLSIVV